MCMYFEETGLKSVGSVGLGGCDVKEASVVNRESGLPGLCFDQRLRAWVSLSR